METVTIPNKERTHFIIYMVDDGKLTELLALIEQGKTKEELEEIGVRIKKRIIPSAN